MTAPSSRERLVGRLHAAELRLLILGDPSGDTPERARRRRELVELVERYRADLTDGARLPYSDE